MAGMFELFIDAEASFRFQLTAPDGTVMAVSRPFPSKAAAVEGIAAVREYAGMGHVKELAAPPSERHFGSRPHTAVRPLPKRMPLKCQGLAG